MRVYTGYEGEPEIYLKLEKKPKFGLHIWDGYFEDIFGTPNMDGEHWQGFTRDYHEVCRLFSGEGAYSIEETEEYWSNLQSY